MLNKPISSHVENFISNNSLLSGNSDMSCVAFKAVIQEAVVSVCTKENIYMAFSATGIIPFNPAKIQLENYPRSFANVQSESPVKATCSSCRLKNVELNPLLKQGVIPKNISYVFTYTPPPTKTRTKLKIVKNARIVTSEEVRSEVEEVEKWKNDKLMVKIQPKKRKLCAKKDLKTLDKDNHDNFSSDDGERSLNDNNDCYNDDVTDDSHDSDNVSSISDSDNDDDYSSDDDFENGKYKQIKLLWDT